MIKVNLVPGDVLAKAQQKQKALQIGVAGGAVALLILLISLAFVWRLRALERRLVEQQAEFKRLSVVVAKVKEAEGLANALRARLKVIDDLDRGRRAYPYFMSDFARAVPGGVRVISMKTTGGNSIPLKLDIRAEARTNEDIALWVRQLADAKKFAGMELGTVTSAESATGVVRNFSLKATYTPQL
ncbi:MAG: PilN domain-containing protein [Elusimicrobia bacterium]|nr:PilN domain-containing protein [Elusimicrobiota bacterium]